MVLIIACKQSICSLKKRSETSVQCTISDDGVQSCFCLRQLFTIRTVIVPGTHTVNCHLMSRWVRATYQPGTGCTLPSRETITSLSASENESKRKPKPALTHLFWTRWAFLSSCLHTVRSCSFFIRLQYISLCQHDIICNRVIYLPCWNKGSSHAT